MSQSEREPDDTPLRLEHVQTFLRWYGARIKLRRYDGMDEQWHRALNRCTLGQLRNGMRSLQRFVETPTLSAPEFWALCQHEPKPEAIREFQKMREALRNPPKVVKAKRRTTGDEGATGGDDDDDDASRGASLDPGGGSVPGGAGARS